jgi:F-type H+-transporting ATPase subunit delta
VVESTEPGELGAVARDAESIEQVVLANPALRAALSDTAVPGASRRAVLLDLLDGKVAAPARRLAAFAAMTVGAPEVTGALGWVATRLRHAAEGQPLVEPPLSLSASRRRVGGYATAVFEDLSMGELESLEDDLFRFSRIVAATPALRGALADRDMPLPVRLGLVTELLEGKVPATSLALVRYAVTGGRARDIVGTLDHLVDLAAQARGWRIAHVRAAAPIDDAQRAALGESLTALTGAPVELQVVIDESLLSGARIRIGDLQVDATARGRIDALREHLAPAGWQPAGFGTDERGQTRTTPNTATPNTATPNTATPNTATRTKGAQ